MRYPYNLLEDYVQAMYKSIGIYNPHQLVPEEIATRLGISLVYLPMASVYVENVIIIDSRKSEIEQWYEFSHELCHALIHVGNQNVMPTPFRLYQEWKANNFAAHACVPTFMLNSLDLPAYESKAIHIIHKTFRVEHHIAQKRLRQYLQNMQCIV